MSHLFLTVPHGACETILLGHYCDFIATFVADTIYNRLKNKTKWIVHAPMVQTFIPRTLLDMNRIPSRSSFFRNQIRQAVKDHCDSSNSCLLLDIHSFYPSHLYDNVTFIKDNEWRISTKKKESWDIIFYDFFDYPKQKPLCFQFVQFLSKHNPPCKIGILQGSSKNDIIIDIRSCQVPAFLIEWNELNSPETVDWFVTTLGKFLQHK